jgi:sigma-E factor negative regulatory protein RseA
MSADRPLESQSSAQSAGEWLSTLVDGEASRASLEQACHDWRSSADVRRDWHAYHLIGDVMRSDELSASPQRDAAFLRALRTRLAAEPVPLSPQPLPAPTAPAVIRSSSSGRRWLMPVAAAAGFAAVGVSVLVLGGGAGGPTGWGEPIAVVQPAPGSSLQRTVNAPVGASAPTYVLDGQIIRDARLDAYFEAHRGAAGPMPSAVPGGALRSVEILVPQR